MTKRVVLSGYYGFHNAGDDAICYAIVDALKAHIPDVETIILSNDPEDSMRQYGVKAVNRWQPLEIFRALSQSDLLISGGGSLLQDVTSKNGMLYYLGILEMAHRMGIPSLVYAQGIGPITYARNQRLTAKVMNRAGIISVRDDESKVFLKEIGVRKEIVRTADPVLGVKVTEDDRVQAKRILHNAGYRGEKPLVIASLRPWQEVDRVRLFAQAFDGVAQAGYDVALLAMQPSSDGSLCIATAGHMQEKGILLVEDYSTPVLCALMEQAELVVGMRLHALIMGAVARRKVMALSYDPKIDAFMAQLGAKEILPIRDLRPENLLASLLNLAQAEEPDPRHLDYLARLAELPAKLARASMIY